MEKIVERGLLYDFYGELLTEHQKEIYESVVDQDMSLSEIADEYGISRQGVHDLIRRCDKSLADYEAKLHLLERFMVMRQQITRVRELTEAFSDSHDQTQITEAQQLLDEILQEL